MPNKPKQLNTEIGYIKPRDITEEMAESYIDYAISVIISRALPDVRDGLKPVHRRILYTMGEEGLRHDAKFRKSATVVGSCLGRYHPHGDQAVYDAAMRMAQDFTLRYPLIQGQGNVGCFTKDTKVKLCEERSLSFSDLIKEQKQGKRHWTFSFNPESKKIETAEIENPRMTRLDEKIIEITLDNGEKIKCTLDHLFMLRDGNYKKAINLKEGDSLMPLYAKLYRGKDKNLKGYEMIYQPLRGGWEFTHHLADGWNLKNGIYKKSHGRIRHHKDFNKLNNNPDNVLRIQWQDHWKYHIEIASERHKNNPEYVKKIAEGRRKFWAKKENKALRSRLQAERNKEMWQNPKYRKVWIEARKKMWQDSEYKGFMRKASSKNLKNLWKRKDFQELLSKLKSEEMKKRWQDKEYRARQIQALREASLKMWRNLEYREHMSRLMKEKYSDPLWRAKQVNASKKLWENSEYRRKTRRALKTLWQNPEHWAKYEKDCFSKMAKKLWEKPGIREFHREKLLRQRQDEGFRKKHRRGVIISNKHRMKENPDMIEELTEKAKIALHKNWQNPAYKERVMRSKILGFVYSLTKKYPKVTPKIYEKERTNNGVPGIENALNYFNGFQEIVEQAPRYNHKVIATRILRRREDVYDLTCEPWHNFLLNAGVFVHNSIDDPSEFAAMRYTEMRLSKIGEEMLRDIEKNTVDFMDNYDGTRKEPKVLPSPLPQLLLNGSLGIAVGMATNIPPHNLSEVVDSLIYLIDHPKATTEDLFRIIKGPDFPTGGIIYDEKEIIQAYSQGKGPIVMRSKVEIVEPKSGCLQIIISEIPFQVQKSVLLEQFANLVQEKKIEGIKDVRDESDREGLRIALDLKPDALPQKILNFLYKFTDLQKTFHLNMLALVDGIQPKVLSLVDILNYFISHRKEVVHRRTKYDLEKAKERAHILEGLNKCLANIDAVIKTIKNSDSRQEAEKNLIKRFKLTHLQANAILETKLSALAKLERKKIEEELKQIKLKIKELAAILRTPQKIKEVIKKELKALRDNFGDERRTKVSLHKIGEISEADLIPQEETIITLTQGGYIKRINPKTYKIQKRGGKGILGMKTLQDDIVEHFLLAKTHDSLLFFTDSGKVFRTPVYEIPEGNRVARGRGLLNFLEISPQEKVLALIPIGKEDYNLGINYLVMVTQDGIIKKTALSEFESVRRSGLIAITLKKDDVLKEVCKSTGQDEITLVTKKGQTIRFKEKEIREMGRSAAGLKGIRLKQPSSRAQVEGGDKVAGMEIIKVKSKNEKVKTEKEFLLVVTENGYGKRTNLAEYRLQQRGGAGIKTARITDRTGDLVAVKVLSGREEELIVISQKGQVIKTKISSIPKLSRATQGVKIMRLDEGDKIASVTCL